MAIGAFARTMLTHEARALLARLVLIKPFALQEPMLPAAALMPDASVAIDRFLAAGRRELRRLVRGYLGWLQAPHGETATDEEAQRRFAILRLKFNVVLVQFDTFADVITQRSENETGVWLSGLDVVAADALALPDYYEAPPVICYLDRDIGAAIRRARTRMPGGGENPVAIVRVPRERMIGTGIASSLVHEVGHQAAALLDLVNSLRPALRARQREAAPAPFVWKLWERWISEIVADLWSVARVGIAATLGLMAVVSLPRAFVFRMNANDPHPMPWIRVKLSAAIGQVLYPHPQWRDLSDAWERFYPRHDMTPQTDAVLDALQDSMPAFVALLINHRPRSLRGRSLVEVLETRERQPSRLSALYRAWHTNPSDMYRAQPSLVFAVIGQARSDNQVSPEDESKLLCKLLTFWALRATVNMSEMCATSSTAPSRAA
jgi:hypothetical protein